ncbi:putative Ribosome biogenesis regulatory protein [Seiridium cardinale]|uniref:Ribosome biogenesis regulatory protein n=2 Tax=Seiridium TaxID=138063 RepID=A0ABR2UF20_9PEZI
MAPVQKLEVQVNKPTPYTFDLGLLLANDPNPLPPSDPSVSLEERLAQTARDGAQSLINQLLTTLPLQSTQAGVLLDLPQVTTPLPREKPLPAAKEQTKWEKFAAKKGIKPKTREQRRMKGKQFNESTGEWENTWGYKGKQEKKEGVVPDDWVVEVDENGEAKGGQSKGAANKKRRIKS